MSGDMEGGVVSEGAWSDSREKQDTLARATRITRRDAH